MKKVLKIVLVFCFINLSFSQEENVNSNSEERSNDIEKEEVSLDIIEQVPVYKGCDKRLNNSALRKCMSDAVNKHIRRNFNTDIANGLGLDGAKTKVFCRFTIDKDGSVINIKTRGAHPKIEDEARRIIKLIPIFDKPGMQRNRPVKVTFDQPISFNIDDGIAAIPKKYTPVKGLDSFPRHKRCSETLSVESQKECTSEKIAEFIQLSVDLELANLLFPQKKTTQFLLEFIIDKKGRIKNINAKAHHKAMAIEAIKVAKRLPRLEAPGFKNGKAVDVPFSMLMTIYF